MVLGFFKNSFQKLCNALEKTRHFFGDKLRALFQGPLDEKMLDTLEELLFEADFGVQQAADLATKVRTYLRRNPKADADSVIAFMKAELISALSSANCALAFSPSPTLPTVIMIVGANGNGKTTTIAKLAHRFGQEGKKVLLAAADTFRAGAQEQLGIWAERLGVHLVSGAYKSDPAAVVFDACQAAIARNIDVVLIDTAGRLENKTHLMKELEKIRRSSSRHIEGAPHETLLVLDATMGQNALVQAESFHGHTPLSGLVLTKLDGTAKGGAAIAIQHAINIPIKFLAVGEGVEDLVPFEAASFVDALLARS